MTSKSCKYQIQKKSNPLHGTILFKITFEELGRFHVHSHSSKHNSKVVIFTTLQVIKKQNQLSHG